MIQYILSFFSKKKTASHKRNVQQASPTLPYNLAFESTELAEIFIEEAEEIIFTIEEQTFHWQNNLKDLKPVQELQRAMHTLKSTSKLAGVDSISVITQKLEHLYEAICDGRVRPSLKMIGALENVHFQLAEMVYSVKNGRVTKLPEKSLNWLNAQTYYI